MGKKGDFFETFDSAGGPIQKGSSDDMEHRDSAGGLSSKGEESDQGSVPEVPSKKR